MLAARRLELGARHEGKADILEGDIEPELGVQALPVVLGQDQPLAGQPGTGITLGSFKAG